MSSVLDKFRSAIGAILKKQPLKLKITSEN